MPARILYLSIYYKVGVSMSNDEFVTAIDYPQPFNEYVVALCGSASRYVCIMSPNLDNAAFDHSELVDALSALARSSRQTQIRILVSNARQEPATRPGEIRPRDLERAMAQLQAALDQASGDHWFGELVTEPRYDLAELDCELDEAMAELADGPEFVALSAAAKLAWQQEAEGITVFANGESQTFDVSVLPSLVILCKNWRLASNELEDALADASTYTLLEYLLQSGCLYVQ